jgi:hypothetical protein
LIKIRNDSLSEHRGLAAGSGIISVPKNRDRIERSNTWWPFAALFLAIISTSPGFVVLQLPAAL